MKGKLILFVEDELALAEIVGESLREKGFTITHAATAAAALKNYYDIKPDLIILDVMLPDGDGFELAAKLRASDFDTPILFLTSRSRPEDVVSGFEHGGNDYLKKPFSLMELTIRIQSLLHNGRMIARKEVRPDVVEIGKYLFQHAFCRLDLAGMSRTLTSRESEILYLLWLNKNHMMERQTLLMKFWGNDDYFSGRSLDVFISKLRKYLHDDASVMIINIRGKGYKLVM